MRVRSPPLLYAVLDANGQKLAYVYFEDEPQRATTLQRISKDDAWQLARLT